MGNSEPIDEKIETTCGVCYYKTLVDCADKDGGQTGGG